MNEPKQCECQDCGRRFLRGEQGDNELYCLRCEYSARIEKMHPDEYEDYLVHGDPADDYRD